MRLPLVSDHAIAQTVCYFSNVVNLWSRLSSEAGEDFCNLLKNIYVIGMFCLCNSMMGCAWIAHNLRDICV